MLHDVCNRNTLQSNLGKYEVITYMCRYRLLWN